MVEPLFTDRNLDLRTSLTLDDRYRYEVLKNGAKIDELSLEVKAAADGTCYFDSGRGKLFFNKHEGTFYVYQLQGGDPYRSAR